MILFSKGARVLPLEDEALIKHAVELMRFVLQPYRSLNNAQSIIEHAGLL